MSANMAQADPVRISEVGSEFEQLAIQHKMLDENLEALERRIEPVLAQRKAGNTDSSASPEPVRVPLAQRVHDHVGHMSRINERLRSIIDRVEL